jgi:hypothetical protein
MGFDQSSITSLSVARDGAEMVVSWTSSAPPGTMFQAYLGRRLAWWGTASAARLPWPAAAAGALAVDVGTIAWAGYGLGGYGQGGWDQNADAPSADFSASLPAAPADRARLDWDGGTFLSPAIAGYRIYSSPAPGAAVSYAAPVAVVAAYVGPPNDGYDLGGYGEGGFGRSRVGYSWTSPRLAGGTWQFAVVPYDDAGNSGATPAVTTVTIAAPPRAPAADPQGRRLTHTLDATTGVATLAWLPSPA